MRRFLNKQRFTLAGFFLSGWALAAYGKTWSYQTKLICIPSGMLLCCRFSLLHHKRQWGVAAQNTLSFWSAMTLYWTQTYLVSATIQQRHLRGPHI